MKSQPMHTRFAPSPTGFLHIGGARTALFNYLLAKQTGGKFLLRVEDTDEARNTADAYEAITDGLRWLGIDWDGDIVYQSQRRDIYNQYIQQLLETHHAYYCECSRDLLDEKRKKAQKEGRKPQYDRTCRDKNLGPGEGRVVRFKCPLEGKTVVHDLIKGDVTVENQEIDDMVIQRADGASTYNFVVVVDDHDMNMTHVLRGDDHLNNTPKQILLYQALGFELPSFGHMPLILGSDKTRLSKRHGATSVQHYRDEGYLPEAMINFLARLGWSHGDKEIFTKEELVEIFNLEHVGKSAGIFNIEKLNWTNQHYLRELSNDELTEAVKPFILNGSKYLNTPGWQAQIEESKERCKTLKDFYEHARYFFDDAIEFDEKAKAKFLTKDLEPALQSLIDATQKLSSYTEESIASAFAQVLNDHNIKMKNLAQPVRVALTGSTTSPGIYRLMFIVGQDRTVSRLKKAVEVLS